MIFHVPHLEQVNQNINARTPNGCEECLKLGISVGSF